MNPTIFYKPLYFAQSESTETRANAPKPITGTARKICGKLSSLTTFYNQQQQKGGNEDDNENVYPKQ